MTPAAGNRRFRLAVCVLASGSKGNAIYVSDGQTAILIDAGLSGNEIVRRMKLKGLSAENLDAVLVTHEHSDHIQGVGVLSRKFALPVYMSQKAGNAIGSQIGRIKDPIFFNSGESFLLKTLTIHPFSISHDAEDPAGFTIKQNGVKIGIATDLGIATSMVKYHLKDCALLIVEANHDATMLMEGPYPWFIKQRIKGRTGHLSNADLRSLLEEVSHDRLTHVILAHLSEINNTPQMAMETVKSALSRNNTRMIIAQQDRCSDIIHL
ncbi:MAG: MBL fold metallo-hydrolase [Deltaproteobacteria bacterium]|nr:MBL fold metallo-hydrolase [Deltaproteobacteria bacterium]MBW1959852.1 MBL fold metallo-hydrolase [Deltaproteobacteria bacterium]MBW1993213.1 MBL fold metallo-hydrolase [Deltaproteobacteria bacterium]MBW2150366.1 MBL fold metallo-hydrolase [Deltaproteobacteria bacterium]